MPGTYKSNITKYSSETVGPMDSGLTLVNPSPPIHLEFDRNSVVNAMLLKNSQPAYTIRTKQKTRSARTDVVDIKTQEVIASIEIKEIFPDMVTIASVNGGNSIKINKWMKEEQLPDKTSVFSNTTTIRY